MEQPVHLWHVIVTVGGETQCSSKLHDALRALQAERPFIHSVRYDEGRAELQYWEEAEEMVDAASLALRLWNEHRDSAGLPAWKVVGLEVVEQETWQSRHVITPLSQANVTPRRF
ncbi:MAG: hypothetical protein H0U61_00855 [Nocardioidaceae bacterium]|nr:hypothetical protein [Nocardioidaceae bacterium]